MKSALMVAGAAAGVAAAASWLGKKRHLKAVETPRQVAPREELDSSSSESLYSSRDALIEPESAELPIGRSADPAIDVSLSHGTSRDDTSGGSLLAEYDDEPAPRSADIDLPLDDVWSSTPGIAEPEQSEGYDAVLPEDLGTVWIQRATQTTHEELPHASDPSELPQLEDLISQASIASAAGGLDEEDEVEHEDQIADDELDDDYELSDDNRRG